MGTTNWIKVCNKIDLLPDAGVAVLLENVQIALFFLPREQRVYALSNKDPVTGAQVISRGLLGYQTEQRYVASPLLKQRYALDTGMGLDDDSAQLISWQARLVADVVEILISPLLCKSTVAKDARNT